MPVLEVEHLTVQFGKAPMLRDLPLSGYDLLAVVLAAVATALGSGGAPRLHVERGPLTIAVAAGVFLVSPVKE